MIFFIHIAFEKAEKFMNFSAFFDTSCMKYIPQNMLEENTYGKLS